MTHTNIDEAQIRKAAYLLWLDEGQPEGCDEQHWLKAIDALAPSKPKSKLARKAASKPRAAKAAPKPAAKSKAKPKGAAK